MISFNGAFNCNPIETSSDFLSSLTTTEQPISLQYKTNLNQKKNIK